MNRTTSDLLRREFPSVYKDVQFYCDDGWCEILKRLGRALTASGDKVQALKEKYAILDITIAPPNWPDGNLMTRKAVREAIEASAVTCETCGSPGRHTENDNRYEKTLCHACCPTDDVVDDEDAHVLLGNAAREMAGLLANASEADIQIVITSLEQEAKVRKSKIPREVAGRDIRVVDALTKVTNLYKSLL